MAKNSLREMPATSNESSQWPIFAIANFAYVHRVRANFRERNCFLAVARNRSESHVNLNTCFFVKENDKRVESDPVSKSPAKYAENGSSHVAHFNAVSMETAYLPRWFYS